MKLLGTKEFRQLTKAEQNRFIETYKDDVWNETNVNFAKLQKNWIILDCIVEHDYMKMDKEEILLHIANWYEVYRLNSKLPNEEAQVKWFNEKLTEIFGDPEFIYKYLDKLERIGQ